MTAWDQDFSPALREKKVAGFLSVLYLYLGDLIPETSSPISKVISAGFQQRQYSSFDTWVLFLITSVILTRDLLVGLVFEKKREKTKTKLHWCQLIWGFQLHVQFLMWGMSLHTHTPIHLNLFEVTEEMKCGRLEFIGQRLWQLDDVGLRF